MTDIGGNTILKLQVKTGKFTLNSIGERIPELIDYKSLIGFLDLSTCDAKHPIYNAKIQERDPIFLCNYEEIEYNVNELTAFNNGKKYEIILVDNPMGLNEHLEIYLRYVGE